MAERPIGVDLVMVTAANASSFHIVALYEIRDNRLSCALSDSNSYGNVAATDTRVVGDAD
jgi:hypothetical protein